MDPLHSAVVKAKKRGRERMCGGISVGGTSVWAGEGRAENPHVRRECRTVDQSARGERKRGSRQGKTAHKHDTNIQKTTNNKRNSINTNNNSSSSRSGLNLM